MTFALMFPGIIRLSEYILKYDGHAGLCFSVAIMCFKLKGILIGYIFILDIFELNV